MKKPMYALNNADIWKNCIDRTHMNVLSLKEFLLSFEGAYMIGMHIEEMQENKNWRLPYTFQTWIKFDTTQFKRNILLCQ